MSSKSKDRVFRLFDQFCSTLIYISDSSLDCGLNLATTASVSAATEMGFGSSTDGNIFSPASVSSCATSCGKTQPRTLSPLSSSAPHELSSSSASTTIFKCNICEYFVQSKKDMESHIEAVHPSAEIDDYISIPTNTAALQAFQTAVAAAALAAVQRCSATPTSTPTPTATPTTPDERGMGIDIDDCPVEIKRERLDETDETIRAEAKDSNKIANEKLPQSGVACPLCLESGYCEKSLLEAHLMSVHSVTRDGLARLLQLVNQKAWRPVKNADATTTDDGKSALNDTTPTIAVAMGVMQGMACQQCESNFKHEEQLLQHAQQTQHYPMQNGEYLCLLVNNVSRPCYMSFATLSSMIGHFKDSHMSLVISERHVYKYRCKQCSLAFKTQEKLTAHMLYHSMRDATKCSLCQRNFRSTQALQKHMEQAHSAECTAVTSSSPRDMSPSPLLSAMELDKTPAEPNVFDFTTTRASETGKFSDDLIRFDALENRKQAGSTQKPLYLLIRESI